VQAKMAKLLQWTFMTLLNLNEFLPKISFFLEYLFLYYFNNLNDKVSHHIFLHSYNNKYQLNFPLSKSRETCFHIKNKGSY
jgi:hypothetical protein